MGVLVDIPSEGHVVSGSSINACAEVLRLKATGKGDLSNLFEFLSLGATGKEGRCGQDCQ